MKRTIIKVPAGSYNDFCWKLSKMMIDVESTRSAHSRAKFYDHEGNQVAYYDERKDHGLVYNYHTHSDLVGKNLKIF